MARAQTLKLVTKGTFGFTKRDLRLTGMAVRRATGSFWITDSYFGQQDGELLLTRETILRTGPLDRDCKEEYVGGPQA